MGRKRKRPSGVEPDGAPGASSSKHLKNNHSSPPVDDSHSHPVLCRYFPKVQTLRQYLLSRFSHSSKSKRRKITTLRCNSRDDDEDADEGDDSKLAKLLDSTLVGFGDEAGSESRCRTKDFELFSQQFSPTAASSLGEGTVSQPEVNKNLFGN